MTTTIDDPQHPGIIDVTGWDLDGMRRILHGLRDYLAADHPHRPLSNPELDLLASPVGGLSDDGYWSTHSVFVGEALDRMLLVVGEAIFQRDLAEALEVLKDRVVAELTPAQARAYDAYVGNL